MPSCRSKLLSRQQETQLTVQLGARLRACSSITKQAGTLGKELHARDGYFYDNESDISGDASREEVTFIKSAPAVTDDATTEKYRAMSSRLLRAHRRMRVMSATGPPRPSAASRLSEGDAFARTESIVTVATARSGSRCDERGVTPDQLRMEGEKVEEGKVDADQVDAERALSHKDSHEIGLGFSASIGDVGVVAEEVSGADIGGRPAIEGRTSRESTRKRAISGSKTSFVDSERGGAETAYVGTLRPVSDRTGSAGSDGQMDDYLEKICSDTTVLTEVSMRISSGQQQAAKERQALLRSMEEWLVKILRRTSSTDTGVGSNISTERAREEIALKLLKALERLGQSRDVVE